MPKKLITLTDAQVKGLNHLERVSADAYKVWQATIKTLHAAMVDITRVRFPDYDRTQFAPPPELVETALIVEVDSEES